MSRRISAFLVLLLTFSNPSVGRSGPLGFDFPAEGQVPIFTDTGSNADALRYEFDWPIRKVAVIGAGVGGLIAYRELKDAGFETHLFERDDAPGGNWHYSDETPVDTPLPSPKDVRHNDYEPWNPPPEAVELPYAKEYGKEEALEIRREHRAPKPIWKSLTSNAPGPIQQVREFPWPAGTPWALPNQKLQRYLRAFATWHGVNSNDNNPNAFYNTRLEHVEKHYSNEGKREGWDLSFTRLEPIAQTGGVRVVWSKRRFDAIVVATGRYNSPYVPDIEGLHQWAKAFPNRIRHSRQYRVPEHYKNQTVLIVGAATSGGEISRDITFDAAKVYQSIRPNTAPINERPQSAFLSRIPQNVTVVPEIKRFLPITHSVQNDITKAGIELINGTVITGIDSIIFATGYRYVYPFLPQYHNSTLGYSDHAAEGKHHGDTPIVTDGTHLRGLYLDSFYIPDPTLTFINANYGMQSFTYAEYVSLAIAKVWSRTADLPPSGELRKIYFELYKQRGGYGRNFQFLGVKGTKEHLRFFQAWLNSAAVRYGGKTIDGLPKSNDEISAAWSRARFGQSAEGHIGINAAGSREEVAPRVTGEEDWVQESVFSDDW